MSVEILEVPKAPEPLQVRVVTPAGGGEQPMTRTWLRRYYRLVEAARQ